MSDERIQELLEALGLSFPCDLRRRALLYETRKVAEAEARAFYLAVLARPDVPGYVKREIAVELEWWQFTDLVTTLAALSAELPGLDLQIEALTALAEGDRCACDVYAARSAKAPSPLMEEVRPLAVEHPQVQELEVRCTVCGTTWVHRQEHHERGATNHRWRRAEAGSSSR